MIDIRLSLWEPTDIKGIPYYAANDNTMKWATSTELSPEEMAKKYKTIVLFLDEMNLVAPSTGSLTQLIPNRRVGNYVLSDNVQLLAPGNREADKGVTYRMSVWGKPFIHLEMAVEFQDWLQWGLDNRTQRRCRLLNFCEERLI